MLKYFSFENLNYYKLHAKVLNSFIRSLQPLSDTRLTVGEKLVLECVIPPFPVPEKVQWFKNEIELFSCPDYEITFTLGVCRLAIPQVYPEDSGRYSCTVYIAGHPCTTNMYLIVNGEINYPLLLA